MRVLLVPLQAVDRSDPQSLNGAGVETARIDAESVGVRTRHVKRLDAAGRAKQMFRGMRVEAVSRQRIAAGGEFEALGRNDEVQKAGFAANRAVAVIDRQYRRGDDFESDAAAVAATLVCNHRGHVAYPPSRAPARRDLSSRYYPRGSRTFRAARAAILARCEMSTAAAGPTNARFSNSMSDPWKKCGAWLMAIWRESGGNT